MSDRSDVRGDASSVGPGTAGPSPEDRPEPDDRSEQEHPDNAKSAAGWWFGASSGMKAAVLAASALVAAGAVGAAVLLPDRDDEEVATKEPSTTMTTVVETTTTTESPWSPEEQEVIDAHEAAMDASLEAAEGPEPDPEHPELGETYTGERLGQEASGLEAMVLNRTAIRFPENEDPIYETTVHSVSFDEAAGVEIAYLKVCTTTNWEDFSVETGRSLSRSGLRTIKITETFHKVDETWKAAELEHHETEDGEVECAFD